ncbi:uncharacterized protein [Rutidosis leptorrhynchoides]|uniref:uncharacterized protein n=1 Tax=Rutidosis leptorrhynchoides TaxID=125765 RepID=UPI003A99E340
MHTDGAYGSEGAGAGIVLKSPEGEEYTFALRFSFPVTNNEAEYEALLSGMRVAKYLEVKELSVYVGSQLVANQFNGIFEEHDETMQKLMQKYLKLVQELAVDFDLFQITQVSRTLNKKVDALSKLAALTFSHFKKEIWVEEVKVKSIYTGSVSAAVEEEEQSWMTPIVEFLNKGTFPIDSMEARKIKMKAPMYFLDKGILYRKSFLGPHLQCLNPTQAESIIREVHEGMCALHSGHKTMASKNNAARILLDVNVQRCRRGNTQMSVVPAARTRPGGVKFLVVAIDYFTKWFEGNPFSDWCQDLNIKRTFTSVAHPQANDQCEVTNRDIVLGIKARPGLYRRGWIDEPPNVLWAHRTIPKGATNETPFSLVYGSEAVILAEINMPTMRIASFDESSNSEQLHENLNLVEERREMAAIKEAINKQRIASYYNKRVQPLSFQLNDLVWRKNEANSEMSRSY